MKLLRVSFLLVTVIIGSATMSKADILNNWDLEDWGKSLQYDGYNLHPISGWSKSVGDTFITRLNCLNNAGDHVLVEMITINGKFKMKMYPPQQKVKNSARKVELGVSVVYVENIIKINIKNKGGIKNEEIPISLIILDQALIELSSKKQEMNLVLYGKKNAEITLPKEFSTKKNDLGGYSFTLLCTYEQNQIFNKSFFITPYNGKLSIQSLP